MMKIRTSDLQKKYTVPRNDIELIISKLLNLSKAQVLAKKEIDIPRKKFEELEFLLRQKKKGEPTAYILGEKSFWENEFFVNQETLIPRPETEELVAIVKDWIKNNKPEIVADIGTGSGAIAISLAKMHHHSELDSESYKTEFYASDISGPALQIAKKNAKKIGAKVKFMKSNLLKTYLKHKIRPDLIIANLPYVPNPEYSTLEKNISFEPKKALVGGIDGMRLIKKLILQTIQLQKLHTPLAPLKERIKKEPPLGRVRGGCATTTIFLETNHDQKEKIYKFLNKTCSSKFEYESIKDFSGRDRFVKIELL